MKNIIEKNRSYRRFYGDSNIEDSLLEELIDLARLSASGANLQPLKYIISSDKLKNDKIFDSLRWAGYLKDWEGPIESERPTGYVVVLGDTTISKNFGIDHGIACQSILLGAVEKGLGGCIFASIDRPKLVKDLNIPSKYEVLIVIALGKPKENVIITEIDSNADIKYFRDKDENHIVPKRKLVDIILKL